MSNGAGHHALSEQSITFSTGRSENGEAYRMSLTDARGMQRFHSFSFEFCNFDQKIENKRSGITLNLFKYKRKEHRGNQWHGKREMKGQRQSLAGKIFRKCLEWFQTYLKTSLLGRCPRPRSRAKGPWESLLFDEFQIKAKIAINLRETGKRSLYFPASPLWDFRQIQFFQIPIEHRRQKRRF